MVVTDSDLHLSLGGKMSRWSQRKEAYIMMKEIEGELEELGTESQVSTKPRVQQEEREAELLAVIFDVLKGQVKGKTEVTGLTVLLNALSTEVSIQIRLK